MTRCITWSTGKRPNTARAAFLANYLQDPDARLVVVRWAEDTPDKTIYGDKAIVLDVPGGTRAQCHNAGLSIWRDYMGGQLPDYWHTLDDDMVLCRGYFDRMEKVLAEDPGIYLLGPWNDCAQRQTNGDWHGFSELVAGEWVQYGNDFNVGGAGQCWPKRTIERFKGYDESMEWIEDHDITQRVRAEGLQACVARSVFAVILEDDNVWPEYRTTMFGRFLEMRKTRLGW